uniref:(northern house mosquito) hypothetical protein n=1 Tax=Culex pipiens TaxID=7175 RepID=A0A8D8D1H2_CULPI
MRDSPENSPAVRLAKLPSAVPLLISRGVPDEDLLAATGVDVRWTFLSVVVCVSSSGVEVLMWLMSRRDLSSRLHGLDESESELRSEWVRIISSRAMNSFRLRGFPEAASFEEGFFRRRSSARDNEELLE